MVNFGEMHVTRSTRSVEQHCLLVHAAHHELQQLSIAVHHLPHLGFTRKNALPRQEIEERHVKRLCQAARLISHPSPKNVST